MAERPTELTMVVTNSEVLDGQCSSSHVFGTDGGCLGSDQGACDWWLPDTAGRVSGVHAFVGYEDGRFILQAEGGDTCINNGRQPLGRNQKVSLSDGDTLVIGDYHVRVHAGSGNEYLGISALAGALTGGREAVMTADGGPLMAEKADDAGDPLVALGGQSDPGRHVDDPIKALEGAMEGNKKNGSVNGEWTGPDGGRDLRSREESAMMSPAQPRSTEAREDELKALEQSVGAHLDERWSGPETATATAGAAGGASIQPLLGALGVNLEFRDAAEQREFLALVGETVKATVTGLCELHRTRHESRYPLRDRRLQPIEDNPLRLEQDYHETVRTMFSSDRSPVHLAPAAAVSESLELMSRHQQAMETAISAGLQTLLSAFEPDTLQRRFAAYRTGDEAEARGDGWSWRMYRHYFAELNSDRQQGFAKLFWEVFEQAYDQSVRSRQGETK
ncbi:type VI secretion system-associated FHA domain protein TagH [Thioalkalivibrio sp. ALR17-21]|uniref:type VI secretion system-associated FHA domain protein TagH n=1 Tax=Thioalkalivibrio sp. ALR17-21 TaxID=1269813 RepID=UPI001E5ED547|nr:type VI secretion system-associated FHA domain protein TagH [Thioalkalivibrio sp. ALR17-21]